MPVLALVGQLVWHAWFIINIQVNYCVKRNSFQLFPPLVSLSHSICFTFREGIVGHAIGAHCFYYHKYKQITGEEREEKKKPTHNHMAWTGYGI